MTDPARGRHAVAHGAVAFGPSTDPTMTGSVARIERGNGHLEVPGIRELGTADFSLGLWVNANARPTSPLGDLAAFFDPTARRGFTLGFRHEAICGSHCNDRNLFFGLDAGREPRWTDHGSPAKAAVMIYALVVHDDHLYAATWEESSSPLGHVYRLEGREWVDCGTPWDANAVTRLAVHEGHLYAGVSRVKGGGSGRPDSLNQNPGGRILRYEGGTEWSDCGQLEGADSVGGLVPFDGALYATPLYSQGLFRMDAPGRWTWCGTPGRRLLALGVHDGALYGAGNDHVHVESAIEQTRAGVVVAAESSEGGGGVFRYDGGERWTSCGLQPDTTQIYSIETHGGQMYISTWPTGLVFRLGPSGRWESTGRLGRRDRGDGARIVQRDALRGHAAARPGLPPRPATRGGRRSARWTRRPTSSIAGRTPWASIAASCSAARCLARMSTRCRPAWPSPTIERSGSAGGTSRRSAQRGTIALYVDGRRVASRADDDPAVPIDLGRGPTLWLGGGPQAGLDGELARVRLYDRALAAGEIAALAARRGGA